MRKAELIAYGIPEEKVREFHQVYWADVKKQAAMMANGDAGQETALPPSAYRQAISAVLRLINDRERLALILSNVNKHYYQQKNEQSSTSEDAQKSPEKGQEGAS